MVEDSNENGPLAHLVWILVFDDQYDQVGLICLQVFILYPNRLHAGLGFIWSDKSLINIKNRTLEDVLIT